MLDILKIHYDIFKFIIKNLKFNLSNRKLSGSLTNKTSHVRYSISDPGDKEKELEHILKENEKFKKTYEKKI